jgi:hypothetical protein
VGPKAGLDFKEKRKISCSCRELNRIPGRAARSVVAIPTELTMICFDLKVLLHVH